MNNFEVQSKSVEVKVQAGSEDQLNFVKELEDKYPYAKLLVEFLSDGSFLVSGKTLNKNELKKEFVYYDRAYRPDDNTEWYNK